LMSTLPRGYRERTRLLQGVWREPMRSEVRLCLDQG
jgi:hypothetical protein